METYWIVGPYKFNNYDEALRFYHAKDKQYDLLEKLDSATPAYVLLYRKDSSLRD